MALKKRKHSSSERSPPQTSPHILSNEAYEARFKWSPLPTDRPEAYRPGGRHPVILGDVFREGRYRILRKLGYGSFSTVWLARDDVEKRYVALKVMSATAKSLDINNELAMYQQMKATSTTTDDSSSSPAHVSLRSHIVELLDHFTHTGPNGTHNILVTEVMGPNCNTMIEEVRSLTIIGHNAAGNEVQRREQSKGLPLTIAKSILKQVLLGLRGLHKRGIAHGDVQPRNILFAVRELEDVKEGTVAQKLNASSEHGHDAREYVDAELQPLFRAQDTEQAGGRGGGRAKGSRWDVLERFDGKQDLWAPRYRLLEEPLTESVDGECLRMKLADPGSAFRTTNPPDGCVTPVALQAPEQILHLPLNEKIDAWIFGCLLFEFLTGKKMINLFVAGMDDEEDTDDHHLQQMTDVLGPLPSAMREKWPRHDLYYDRDLRKIRSEVTGEDATDGSDDEAQDADEDETLDKDMEEEKDIGEEKAEVYVFPSLEQRFVESTPPEMDEAEAREVIALIRRILQYEPRRRPSVEDVLKEPWVAKVDVPSMARRSKVYD